MRSQTEIIKRIKELEDIYYNEPSSEIQVRINEYWEKHILPEILVLNWILEKIEE